VAGPQFCRMRDVGTYAQLFRCRFKLSQNLNSRRVSCFNDKNVVKGKGFPPVPDSLIKGFARDPVEAQPQTLAAGGWPLLQIIWAINSGRYSDPY